MKLDTLSVWEFFQSIPKFTLHFSYYTLWGYLVFFVVTTYSEEKNCEDYNIKLLLSLYKLGIRFWTFVKYGWRYFLYAIGVMIAGNLFLYLIKPYFSYGSDILPCFLYLIVTRILVIPIYIFHHAIENKKLIKNKNKPHFLVNIYIFSISIILNILFYVPCYIIINNKRKKHAPSIRRSILKMKKELKKPLELPFIIPPEIRYFYIIGGSFVIGICVKALAVLYGGFLYLNKEIHHIKLYSIEST